MSARTASSVIHTYKELLMPEWFRSYLLSLRIREVEDLRTWIRGRHVGAGQEALEAINETLNDNVTAHNELIEAIVDAAVTALRK